MAKKILFFIETLRSGGKERRFIELLYYLNQHSDCIIKVVVMSDNIYYNYIYDLGYEVIIMKRKWFKNDPSIFYRFYNIAKKFKPDIIHSWGKMTTFYAIPTKIIINRPLVSNLISNATKDFNNVFDKIFFE